MGGPIGPPALCLPCGDFERPNELFLENSTRYEFFMIQDAKSSYNLYSPIRIFRRYQSLGRNLSIYRLSI